jgi:hypothetical protein
MLKPTPARILSASLLLTLAACAKKSDNAAPAAPVVAGIQEVHSTNPIAAKAASVDKAGNVLPAQPAKPQGALVSEVTLNKASILNREFNYMSSLQFSSMSDSLGGGTPTAMMGLSLGQVPATFIIMDDKLELVTDGRLNFESDVNHPSRLIYVFPILKQDDTTITIRVDGASPISDTFMFDNKVKTPVRYSFLRSMQYAQEDELMMIESSVEMVDGSIGEFLESFQPRERTVKAGAKVFYNDPDLTKDAARYDFLDAGPVFVAKPTDAKVRVQTKVAYHWDMRDGQPIKWYVTPNIPDEFVEAVKNGVEGWNRYSKAAGMPDLIKFMGKLPDGVKVGDPRYNLIVWDTVQDAGAAYESQNGDPVTGIQSHSMIYIPLAWVNIGKDYWNKFTPDMQDPGKASEEKIKALLKSRNFMDRAVPVNCVESPDMHLDLASKENPDVFAKNLLRGVVFHEVGHSFGLAHQFKGSLSYDSDDLKKLFSSSIMDYNDYNEEEAAFSGDHTADGPLLEYDRQIISYIYNDAKDVKDSDPVLPACADDVADSTDKGVDPLCNRYDIGADVTKEALKALTIFTVEGSKRGAMEAITPKKVTDAFIGLPPAASVKTQDDLLKSLAKAQALEAGVVGIYISASANSFGYLGSIAAKSLKVFQKDVLPEDGGYDENEMRSRALQALEAAASMDQFPDVTAKAVAAAKPAVLQYLQSTAFVAGLPRDGQQKLMDLLSAKLDKILVTDVQTAILAKMQTRFITALANTPTAPIGFLTANGKTTDVELEVMQILAKLSGPVMGNVLRPMAERAAALKSLKTYSVSDNYKGVADKVVSTLQAEIANSTDALRRQAVRDLLAAFTAKEAAPADSK